LVVVIALLVLLCSHAVAAFSTTLPRHHFGVASSSSRTKTELYGITNFFKSKFFGKDEEELTPSHIEDPEKDFSTTLSPPEAEIKKPIEPMEPYFEESGKTDECYTIATYI
jgi:hypothetical protein